jgi:hypothetical protein
LSDHCSRSSCSRASSARGAFSIGSSAREARRALLLERAHAFAIVVAQARLALQVALEIELRVERVRRRRVKGLLQQTIAPGRPACQRAREGERLVGEALVIDRFPD